MRASPLLLPGPRLRILLLAVNALLLATALMLALVLLGVLPSRWLEVGALACGMAASSAVMLLWRKFGGRGGKG